VTPHSATPTSNSQITHPETPIDSLMGEINNLTAPTDINAEDSTPIPDWWALEMDEIYEQLYQQSKGSPPRELGINVQWTVQESH
jgi:hypothetical protein